MCREIKFRAWDKDNNKMLNNINQLWWMDRNWLKGTDATHSLRLSWIEENGMGYWRDIIESQIELMQYTGLKDKNGKEIYEGDIVKWGHLRESREDEIRIATVEINPDIQLNCKNIKYPHVFRYGNFAYNSSVLEIIGNIYENPELLK